MSARGSAKLIREFEAFHAKNPEVYGLFKRFAYEALRRHHERFSADMVLHRVRWETGVVTHGELFKINNNYSAFYSRLFMLQHPAHQGFFRCRASAADQWSPW